MSALSKQDRIYLVGFCYEAHEVMYGKDSESMVLFHELDDETLKKTAQTLDNELYRRDT